jgi:hypothetical protein
MRSNPLSPPGPYLNYNELSPYTLLHKKQSGEGLKEWWEKAKNLASKAGDIYSGELATAVKNLIPSSDENARPSFVGEKHAILQLPNGKYGIASYMGPGTHVLARIKRGDPGRTYMDNVAKAHDLRFALSGGDPNKVREADHKMIAAIHQGQAKKLDTPLNLKAAELLMTGKIMAEELDLLKKGSFASNHPLSIADREILEKSLEPLQQKGLGDSTIERLMKYAKDESKEGKGARQAGEGVLQSGATRYHGNGLAVDDVLVKVAMPLIMKKASKTMEKSGNGARQAGMGKLLTKESLDKIKQKMSQSGEPNADYASKVLFPVLLSGSGVSKEEILSLKDSELFNKFKSMIADILKQFKGKFGNGMLKKGNTRKIAGFANQQIQGNGFWSDFYKGFKYGFRKTKNILSETLGKMNIPGISEAVNIVAKIPDIPDTAKSMKELKAQLKSK